MYICGNWDEEEEEEEEEEEAPGTAPEGAVGQRGVFHQVRSSFTMVTRAKKAIYSYWALEKGSWQSIFGDFIGSRLGEDG